MLYHKEKDCSIKLEAIDIKLENMKTEVSDASDVYAIEDIQSLVRELLGEMTKHEE